jgi:hypothetical protein
MTYYHFEGSLVQPTMEEPKPRYAGGEIPSMIKHAWRDHLRSLPRIKVEGKLKEGWVEEWKDFIIQYHCDNDLCPCCIVGMDSSYCPSVLSVAVPVSETEAKIESLARYSEAVQEMDKAVKCLVLELPTSVWADVSQRWYKVKQSFPAETVEKKFCKHNGVKRIGESCMRNNNCEYPKCLVSAPVDETDYLLSTKANRERLEESINQERAKELYPYPENDLYKPGDPDLEQMIWVVNQKREAYLAGFAASKDYAKGLLEWVGKSYENIEDIVDKPALWKEVGFGADLSHYTTSQLIDLYDEHLNQQK